ncbi:DNA-binding response OmpR family regulator [Jatrophihabitans sp. GAS493]|uniref:response regulator transcription factor n=1 Tax=Jatrophihabitans sp. GAS493 TaxID=1907575 RepID=UPI000BB90E9E|nr:response regulator transcription factor [Jatrophihabitans sp. GAS493]SOD72038.1 DNA-binding response OmpR family regulator [Jatrophihabitans sp. GAS493]
MANILVVDDDTTVAEVVVSYLRRAGHTSSVLGDGQLALDALADATPDLLILDVMLPSVDGLKVCAILRENHPDLPIIMLTALADAEDRIAGLEMGADDYLTKPFSPRELVLRVESVLRRIQPPLASIPSGDAVETPRAAVEELLRAGDLTVNPLSRRVTRGDTELTLTVRELDLLVFLLRNPGRAFNREELMRDVWGWTFGDHSTVTVHVRRLREKVETDPMHPTLIQTVWGIGYRLELP